MKSPRDARPDWLEPYVDKITVVTLTAEEIDEKRIYREDYVKEVHNKCFFWGIEHAQRNALYDGLQVLNSSVPLNGRDLIVLSDIDEFPHKESLIFLANEEHYRGITIFHQDFFYYSFKWMKQKKWYGSMVLEYKDVAMTKYLPG